MVLCRIDAYLLAVSRDHRRKTLTVRWQAWAILALGLYLLASPWLFDLMTSRYALNAALTGSGISMAALLVWQGFRPLPEIVNLGLGFWLMVSPSFLRLDDVGFSGLMNLLFVGSIIATLACWDLCSNAPRRASD